MMILLMIGYERGVGSELLRQCGVDSLEWNQRERERTRRADVDVIVIAGVIRLIR